MRYVYSVLRFVPDPTRGEHINIGLIAGSDEAGEWALKNVSRWARAHYIDDDKILPEVIRRIAELSTQCEAATDDARPGPNTRPSITEDWLLQFARDSGNILQLSPPIPVVADDSQEVFDLLWDRFIVEPGTKARGIKIKRTAVGKVRQSLTKSNIGHHHFQEQVTLHTANSHVEIDFAVHNGQIVHMTHCWSFQLVDQERLLEDVKAWAWTVRDLRRADGHIRMSEDRRLRVPSKVPVAAVYIPPAEDDTAALSEALSVFQDSEVQAKPIELDDVATVGNEAARLLAS